MVRTLTGAVVITLAVAFAVGAQTADTVKPCSAPETSQFDFWVGEWNLTWADSSRGTNIVSKPFGNCVILEQFADADTASLRGMSASVYNPETGKWQQTWVDNFGNYMSFEGEFTDGKMILGREATSREGKPILQRMVWRDITPNNLEWDWQSSEDGGKTWKTNWRIHYTRKQ